MFGGGGFGRVPNICSVTCVSLDSLRVVTTGKVTRNLFPTSNVPNSAVSNAAVNTVVVVLRVGNSISVVERKP